MNLDQQPSNSPLTATKGISKDFSGVRVLDQISIDIFPGEVFGIIGENGAGKSTLIKILSGIYHPSEGQISFEGNPVTVKDPLAARKLGISTIPQEFNLIQHLNVFENIFLGQEQRSKKVFLSKRQMIQKTRTLLGELETKIDPKAKIQSLSVAQKQMVEIAKALAFESKLLIMDEPTTVLARHEIEILFNLMRKLKEKGVTMVYISHKLKEVKEICDRVMILRDGKMISLDPIDEVDEHLRAKRMVGRELSQIFPDKIQPVEEIVFEAKNLSEEKILKDVSFDLRKGEILGFAGLVGAGRTETAETIIGIRKKKRGSLWLKGKEVAIHNPSAAHRYGISYLSEDRQGIGIITNFDIISNITLSSLKDYCKFLIQHKRARKKAAGYVKEFGIRAASLKTKLEFFSGGNQQKVSLAKSLDVDPKILIVDEPTRGIDVQAKREVYHFLNQLARTGISIILISSELEEIIGMCNRVVVMKEGQVTGILSDEHITEHEIMLHATGLKGVA